MWNREVVELRKICACIKVFTSSASAISVELDCGRCISLHTACRCREFVPTLFLFRFFWLADNFFQTNHELWKNWRKGTVKRFNLHLSIFVYAAFNPNYFCVFTNNWKKLLTLNFEFKFTTIQFFLLFIIDHLCKSKLLLTHWLTNEVLYNLDILPKISTMTHANDLSFNYRRQVGDEWEGHSRVSF